MALQTKTITANGSKGHHKFTLTISEESTAIASNSSSVKWSFTLSPIKTGYDWSYSNTVPVSYTITINGVKYSGNIMSYDGKSTITLKSGTETITHNADGKKSISYSFSVSSLNQSFLTGTASNSGSMELTVIPLAAKLIDADSFFDNQNPSIKYSNPAGNSASLLQCSILTESGTIILTRDIPKTDSTYTFILTQAEIEKLWDAANKNGNTSINVIYRLHALVSGYVFTSDLWRYMSLADAEPTLAPIVEDINPITLALTGDKYKVVKGASRMYVKFNAAAKKKASILQASRVLEMNNGGGVIALGGDDTEVYNAVASLYKCAVIDTRGKTAFATLERTVIDYIKLTANTETAIELDTNDGTKSNITVKITGNYWSGNFGAVSNTLTTQYRIKTNSGDWGNWQTITPSISGTTYTASTTIGGLDYKNSYTIQTQVLDKVGTIVSSEYKLKTIPVFDWGENDFAFNVPVSIMGTELVYITAEGTKDGWYYRNWSNGKGECWKTVRVSTAITTAWGSMYRGDSMMTRQNYPFPFKSKPTETATLQSGGNAGFLYAESGGNGVNGTYASAIYNICRPTSATSAADVYISLYAFGDL